MMARSVPRMPCKLYEETFYLPTMKFDLYLKFQNWGTSVTNGDQEILD